MDNSRKLPIFSSIGQAARQQAVRSDNLAGKAMPASVASVNGAAVTVNFEVQTGYPLPKISVPILGSEYIRLPIQPGCKGMVISSDYYLGAMTGLGTGAADMKRRGNLGNLVFVPLGSQSWASVDGDVLTMYGVSGVTITDKDGGNSSVTLTEDSAVLKCGDASVTCSGGKVSVSGTLVINGQEYTAHTHTNGNQGQPTGGVIP